MSITVTDLKTVVAAQAHKVLSLTDHDTAVESWVLRAIRYAQRFDFECWRQEFSLTLTALTYVYPYASAIWPAAALTRPLRLDGDSLEYGDNSSLAFQQSATFLDNALGGPAWKRSATGGTPQYFTERAQSLIIGARPSTEFVADHPLLYGYYYRGEVLSGSGFEDLDLAMYDDFYEHIVTLALVFALQQEDDTTFQTQLQYWLQHDLPLMRGYDHIIEEDEEVPAPEWALYVEGTGVF